MTRDPSPCSPQPSALATIRHDGWTAERQAVFLEALAATHSVTEACQ